MVNRVTTFVFERRKILACCCMLLTVVFSYFAMTQLEIGKNRKPWFEKNDPSLAAFLAFRRTFKTGEIIIAAFELENTITYKDVLVLKELSQEVLELDHVIDALNVGMFFDSGSLRKKSFKKTLKEESPSEKLLISNSFKKNAEQKWLLDNIKVGIDKTPLGSYLISNDFKTVSIVINARYDDSETYKEIAAIKKTINAIKKLQQRYAHKLGKSYLTGNIVVDDMVSMTISEEIALLFPASFCLALVILFLLIRPFSLIFWPVIAISGSLMCTLGIKALCGSEFTILSSCLFAVVLIIGTADSIHLIHSFLEHQKKKNSDRLSNGPVQNENQHIVVETLKTTGVGCFFTSFTTAMGFLSLLLSPIPIVRHLGLFSAIGIMITFFFTMMVCTVGFARFKSTPTIQVNKADVFLNWIVGKIKKPSRSVLAGVLICSFFLSCYGFCGLKVDGTLIHFFKKNTDFYQDFSFMEASLGGLGINEIIIKSDKGAFLKSENIKKLGTVVAEIKGLNKDTECNSGVQIFDLLGHRHGGNQSLGDLVLKEKLAGRGQLEHYFSSDFSSARLSVLTNVSDQQTYKTAFDIVKHRFGDFNVSHTGYGHLTQGITDKIVKTLVYSFFVSLLVISVLMMVIFKFKAGVISLIPNVLPVIALQGIMVLLSYKLNIGTAIISAIALGIVVDDTIHMFWSFRHELKKDGDKQKAMSRCLDKTGRAIIVTSILFVFGLNAFLLSKTATLSDFGFLSSIVIVLALVYDLFLTPVLLTKFDVFKSKTLFGKGKA